jgi:hypothetical protein
MNLLESGFFSKLAMRRLICAFWLTPSGSGQMRLRDVEKTNSIGT